MANYLNRDQSIMKFGVIVNFEVVLGNLHVTSCMS